MVELRVPKCLQFEQEDNSKGQILKYTILAKQLDAILDKKFEQVSIESPLHIKDDDYQNVSSFRSMKFQPGDKIDYYTFNMNLKAKKEKRPQNKLEAKRVSIKFI